MTNKSLNLPKLSELLDTVLDIPESQRAAWLDALSDAYVDLKPQLRELLEFSADHSTNDFLDKPPDFSAALLEEAHRFQQIEVELQADKLMGAYRLLRELGLGGMGAVWLAQRVDGKFKREVALKFPYAGPHQRQLTERLLRERDILASLQHANIARLYDADVTASGQPFLVLEYIDGIAINDYCDQHRLDIRERLMLFQQVLSAVRYAHTHLVIHRDLKPSNILITTDGVAHLLDFGIATSITDGEVRETPLTQFGGHLLTLEYASPEQAAKIPVTTASDVYALGVVLYELLTGASPYPYQRDQRAQLEQAIANANVMLPSRAVISDEAAAFRNIKPRQLSKALRGELDTLLLKALKKNIDDRYASVDAFYQDIARFLDHQPIHAQPDSQWYRIRKFARRNRTAVASFAAIAIALFSGTGIALWQAHVASQQRDRAVAAAARSEAVTDFLQLMVTEVADGNHLVNIQQLVERSEVVATHLYSGNSSQQAAILEVLGNYYLHFVRPDDASKILTKALLVGGDNVDPAFKAKLLCMSAIAQLQVGNAHVAREQLEAGLAVPNHALEVEALCLEGRAFLEYEDNHPEEMMRDIQLAQHQLQRSGVIKPELTIDLLSDAATGDSLLGHINDAQKKFSQAFELLNDSGRGETSTAMEIQRNWAAVLTGNGDPLSALTHYDKAIEIAHKLGGDTPDLGNAVAHRASALHQLSRDTEALAEFEQGFNLAKQQQDVLTMIQAKQGVAEILIALGRTEEAERAIKEFLPMINSQLPNRIERLQYTVTLKGLLAAKQGHYTEAISDFSTNIDFFIARNIHDGSLSHRLAMRCEAYLATNNYAAALTDAMQAYDVARAIQADYAYSSLTGDASLLLTKIAIKRNQSDVARKWATIAYRQLQGSLGDEHPATLEAKQLLDSLQAVS